MGNKKVGRGVRNKTAKCGRRKGEVVVEKRAWRMRDLHVWTIIA